MPLPKNYDTDEENTEENVTSFWAIDNDFLVALFAGVLTTVVLSLATGQYTIGKIAETVIGDAQEEVWM